MLKMKEQRIAPVGSSTDIQVFPLIDKIPKRFRKPVYAAATFLSVSGMAAVCGGDNKNKPEPTSLPSTVSGQNTERFNPSAFLRMPMPRDPDAKVVQAWKYTALINGTLDHDATDLIIGKSLDDSKTWRPFPVLVAADGVACESEYSATKAHPAGNQIEVLHSNKYTTFYIHNDPQSLASRLHALPDCNKTPKSDWLPVKQGDKLSEASDIGAVDGWTHLHFEVKDPTGKIVDPYDLYKTRTGYPSPNFDDGFACGDKTLWINCPTSGANKAEIVPTMALRPTLAPVPTVEVPVIPTVEAARPKPHFVVHDPVNNKDWEFQFKSVIETPSYVYGQTAPREGWKRLIIKGDLLNKNSAVADPEILNDLFIGGGLYKFVLESGGNPYVLIVGGTEVTIPGRPDEITRSFDHESIAAGASKNFIMTADVPKNASDISLSLLAKNGSRLAGPISEQEIAGSGANNEILPGVTKHGIGEAWVMPGYASVRFDSIKTLPATTIANGNFSEEFAVFDVENDSGQDISTQYSLDSEMRSLKVYLPDGRQIDGSRYFYSEEVPQDANIPPGFTKPVYVSFATNALAKEGIGGLVDTSGAVIVLTVSDKRTSNLESFAWQLP
jgi:hypothetical protein